MTLFGVPFFRPPRFSPGAEPRIATFRYLGNREDSTGREQLRKSATTLQCGSIADIGAALVFASL